MFLVEFGDCHVLVARNGMFAVPKATQRGPERTWDIGEWGEEATRQQYICNQQKEWRDCIVPLGEKKTFHECHVVRDVHDAKSFTILAQASMSAMGSERVMKKTR
ncbi:hypothetical protein SCUP234_04113 [Seiridium cupressi]